MDEKELRELASAAAELRWEGKYHYAELIERAKEIIEKFNLEGQNQNG